MIDLQHFASSGVRNHQGGKKRSAEFSKSGGFLAAISLRVGLEAGLLAEKSEVQAQVIPHSNLKVADGSWGTIRQWGRSSNCPQPARAAARSLP